MKAPTALQRGMACLCCRKRKMKCDGARPVCGQCGKANRADECQYYEKKRTSRTQLLQAKITKLEQRLRELEAEQTPPESSSSSGSQSPQMDRLSLSLSQSGDLGLGFDPTSAFNTPELEYLGNGDSFPQFEGELFPSFPDSGSGGLPWSGDGLDFRSSVVDDFLAQCLSNSSMSSLHESSPGPSMTWWENDVFCENKEMLLDIFFAHRHQCAFDVHLGRFKAALLLPSAQKPHPSLADAIYLLACYFSRSPSLTELEPHFLKRSLRGIAEALQNSDRIVHVLQASCLLAVYFFWHGRTLEGYYHSSIAARLAVGLGLHQISSREQFQFQQRAGYQDAPAPLKASVPLNPPSDEVEYAERIAAFWQIFAVDRAWAVATGLPTALPDDDHPRSQITTIWPVAIPDDPEPTHGDLQPFPGAHLSGSSALQALRVKAVALLERSARFSASPAKDDSHYSLEMSLSQFQSNLSNLHGQQFPIPFLSTSEYVSLQTSMYASTIHLHRDALEIQPESYQKCFWAANAMTALVRQLGDNEYDALCPIVSTGWRSAAEAYLRILAMPRQSLPTSVEMLEQQVDTLVGALQRLSLLFPMAGIYAAKIQEDRAASRQTYVPSIA